MAMNLIDLQLFPEKKDDCPALGICEALGNMRPVCRRGSVIANSSHQHCLPSIVLLLARATGQLSKKQLEQILKIRREIGFSAIGDQASHRSS